eukprot:TRINITY_DN3203_c0_g1_i1.p1 TRINITY_DN3203_c0_g1~~TRINITY_DN3203_c0_g1_i1.p1  ORF type:complete len:232 (+),score=50.39 TRINITY_DN3203_c0_g1_i1:177-872(+)
MATGLRAVTTRDAQGRPVLNVSEGEEIRHTQPLTSIALGDKEPQGPGTLFITTKRIFWLNDEDSATGYSVDFLSLSLHAISRDPEAYSLPCIYTQIDTAESDMESGDEGSEEEYSTNGDTLGLSQIKEMRLIPSDPNTLESIFAALCACAELNPDPVTELEGEGDWIFNANEMTPVDLTPEQNEDEWEEDGARQNPIGHSNGVEHGLTENIVELSLNDDRFDDAMELEHKH